MGGAVATLTVERFPQFYHGVYALGAALFIQNDPPEDPIKFLANPQMPILFLSNDSELGAPLDYISKCVQNHAKVIPVLWSVSRGGHIVMHDEEILIGWKGLQNWVENGTIEPKKDITWEPPVTEFISKVTFDQEKKGAWGRVIDVSLYGDILLNFHLFDMEKLFIFDGTIFEIEFFKQNSSTLQQTPTQPKRSVHFGGFPFTGVEHGITPEDQNQSTSI